jgi:RHS repeat-associated protein
MCATLSRRAASFKLWWPRSTAPQLQAENFGRSLFVAQVNDANLSNTQYVTNLYEAFLQRGPDAGGLGWWSGQASVGQDRQNVLNAFATCGAFRELAGTLYREANWLVADHLGTPRMIVNKSGSLASVKRQDYLPFGEELFAGTGGRASTQGYTGDSVRQKFTQKERDIETGLDFFGARYYGSLQARFTSPDPLLSSGHLEDPQTWNRYSYTLNNPLCFVDPTGLFTINSKLSHEQQEQIIAAYDALKAALGKLEVGSKAYDNLERSLNKLGKPGEANGVQVTIGKTVDPRAAGETNPNNIGKGTITITFNENKFSGESVQSRAATLGHEGVHADDAANVFAGSKSMAAFFRTWESYRYQTEYDAHFIDAGIYQVLGKKNTEYGWGYYTPPTPPGKAQNIPHLMDLWNPSWKVLDQKVIESRQGATIRTLLQAPKSTSFGYGLKEPRSFKP